MKRLWKTILNAAFVIGGFFVIFFGASKLSSRHDQLTTLGTSVANADAPSCSSCGDSGAGDSSSCGDCGDCGDSGDCGK